MDLLRVLNDVIYGKVLLRTMSGTAGELFIIIIIIIINICY